jgi:precorrin-2 dehydrogenase/sirohydrochlorin ferrochelatase
MKKGCPSYYPIFLNTHGKKCVVVGGGQVALRKVKALLDAGAKVEVISPDICLEMASLVENKGILIEKRLFQTGDIEGAMVVVAATDNNHVNLEVAREAMKKGILVNVVDDPDNSDFIAPSYFRRGDLTVAVSTAGRSPALAKKIRMKLEDSIGDEYAALALLINEVRTEIKNRGIKLNGEDWQEAMDSDLLIDLLKKNDREQARNLLLNNLKSLQK